MAHEDYYYKYGDHMPDGTLDTRWQTAPDRLLNRTHDVLVDGALGVLEGGRKVRDIYNTTEDYLDEGLARVGDFFDRSPPTMTGGPMSRNGYRHHPGGYVIPANSSLTPEAQAYRDRAALGNPHAQVTIDNTPSHLIPGFGRMVNEGYDSWSPSDGYLEGGTEVVQQDTRSDWQKWKDSVSGGY